MNKRSKNRRRRKMANNNDDSAFKQANISIRKKGAKIKSDDLS